MIYAISYKTESCDEGFLFMESSEYPTTDQVNTLLFGWLEDEYEYGDEDAVSWDIYNPVGEGQPTPDKDQIKAFKKHCKNQCKEYGYDYGTNM